MPTIGQTSAAALVRTDFSDDRMWRSLCDDVLAESEEGFRAYVVIINDSGFSGLSAAEVTAAVTKDYEHSFIIIADEETMDEADHRVLLVDLVDEPGRTFRASPAAVQGIENNLSIGNMSFFEFADNVDDNGVFREFT